MSDTPQRVSGPRAECLLQVDKRCVITDDFDYSTQEAYPKNPPTKTVLSTRSHISSPTPSTPKTHTANVATLAPTCGESWTCLAPTSPTTAIETPHNAITLCPELHYHFGQLKRYLQTSPRPTSQLQNVLGPRPAPIASVPSTGRARRHNHVQRDGGSATTRSKTDCARVV